MLTPAGRLVVLGLLIAAAACFFLGCGVSSRGLAPLEGGAPDPLGNGGRGQDAAGGAAGAAGGAGGELAGAGGQDAAGGAAGSPGDAGDAGPVCLSTNAQGFAWNAPCGDAGAASSCRAACILNGAHFVGCVADSPLGTFCYASCADCP